MADAADQQPSIFTLIIRGDLPGRFVWRDDKVVAFMTIAPLRPGHTLVVPIEQIDHWTDVPADLWAHIGVVQQAVGQALMETFRTARIGSLIAGLEVPHCHIHLVPIDSESQLSFALVDHSPDPADLDAAAAAIRAMLRAHGHEAVPED